MMMSTIVRIRCLSRRYSLKVSRSLMGLKSCALTALLQKNGKVVKFLNIIIHRSSHGDRIIFFQLERLFIQIDISIEVV
jgi:hypothetical protein